MISNVLKWCLSSMRLYQCSLKMTRRDSRTLRWNSSRCGGETRLRLWSRTSETSSAKAVSRFLTLAGRCTMKLAPTTRTWSTTCKWATSSHLKSSESLLESVGRSIPSATQTLTRTCLQRWALTLTSSLVSTIRTRIIVWLTSQWSGSRDLCTIYSAMVLRSSLTHCITTTVNQADSTSILLATTSLSSSMRNWPHTMLLSDHKKFMTGLLIKPSTTCPKNICSLLWVMISITRTPSSTSIL